MSYLNTQDERSVEFGGELFEGLRFQPYTEQFCNEVAAFNRRIAAADPPFLLPEAPVPKWLPRIGDRKIYQEIILAVEQGLVRGSYTLKHQEFSFHGKRLPAAACQMPISEAVADKRYGFIGPRLLRDALRRQPMLFGLGIGSLDASITRVEQAMGWRVRLIPFFYRVRNGFNFLRNIEYLKTSRKRRLMLDAAAFTGVGWAGARLAGIHRNGLQRFFSADEVSTFADWADQLWDACAPLYSMTAVRNAEVLDILYPSKRFIRLRVRQGSRTVGWAVLLDTHMRQNKYFGNMRVGTIVDCLAMPEHARAVIGAATRVLEARNVDLLLSNQSHPAWCDALRHGGYREGPSNFVFTTSKSMTRLLDESDPGFTGVHVNRGDGDGPIHL